jgi:hypothetical protein
MNYSRYKSFVSNGSYKNVPFIGIPVRGTDCYTYYEVGKTRLDLLSYQYYNDPNYGWLILQANPEYGSLEFMIDDNAKLRIPYPLDTAIQGYEDEIERYDKLYGLN